MLPRGGLLRLQQLLLSRRHCCPSVLQQSAAACATLHTAGASRGGAGSSSSSTGSSGGSNTRSSWWGRWLPVAAGAAAAAGAAGTTTAYADAPFWRRQKQQQAPGEQPAAEAAAAAAAAEQLQAQREHPRQPPPALPPADEAGDGVLAGGKLLSLATRQRLFFKYEKRLRDRSNLEKLYDYFATHEDKGTKCMMAADVVRALVPTYPPVGTKMERAGFLDGERGHSVDAVRIAHDDLMSFFDSDKSGTISFNEFVLMVLVLSVPEKDVDAVFDVIDVDNNGVIDEQEFQQVLAQLEKRAGIQASFHARPGKGAAAIKSSIKDDRELAHKVFVDAGGGVSLARFKTFLHRLQEGMLRLEFAHYDTKKSGRICGADFANSLVTAADIKVVDGYLDKVLSMPPELAQAGISYAEFAVMGHMRRNLHMLAYALDFCRQVERKLHKDDVDKLVRRIMGVRLAPHVLDVLFYLFSDEDGTFDGPAFTDVMKRRNRLPGHKKGHRLLDDAEEESGLTSSISNFFSCLSYCTSDGAKP